MNSCSSKFTAAVKTSPYNKGGASAVFEAERYTIMLPPHHTVKVWVPLFKFKAGKHLKRASRYTSV